MQNEAFFIQRLLSFINKVGANASSIQFLISGGTSDFCFMDWNFTFLKKKNNFVSTPSEKNYSLLLRRIKYIVNNSNYGVNIKVQKLFPIIKDWRHYHKFSKLTSFTFFSVKKRALKVFSKESKQDFYSSKRLVDKCFYFINSFSSMFVDPDLRTLVPYFGHLIFCIGYSKFFCIHCGVDIVLKD
jgi:hypothetical protein